VPRVFDEEYNPTQGGFLVRPRGLASESGNFALYIEVMMPIVAGHLWSKGRLYMASIVMAMGTIALLLSFSAAAFIALPLAAVVTFCVRAFVRRGGKGLSTSRLRGRLLITLVPIGLAAI